MKKKIIAFVLSVLMLLSVAPSFAMAASLGDIDSNGKVDATDARTALRAAVGLDKLTAAQTFLADVDFDGDVDATDARFILRAAVGLEELHAHSYTSAVTKAATCEGKGVKTFTCSCGDSYTESIPAVGHKSVTDKAVAPTCTEKGKTEGSHCSVCNKVFTAQKDIKALGHKSVTDKAVAATCTQSGKTEGTHCSVCNAVLKAQNTVPALGHKSVTDKGTAATCTQSGKTDGAHCSVCKEVLKAQEAVEATGHKKSSLDKSTVVAANCTKEGYSGDYKCDACGIVTAKGNVTPKVADSHNYKKESVAASCTTDGYSIWKCTYCGQADSSRGAEPSGRYPNGVGHKFGKKTTVAPTCEEGGYDKRVCSVCSYEERTKPTAAAGHKYKENKAESVAATCIATGKKVSVCEKCQDVKTEELGLTSCTHVTVVVAGTSYANGDSCKTVVKCSVCSKVVSESENFGAHEKMDKINSTEATCETAGTETHRCAACGYENVTVVAEALGHTDTEVKPATCEEPGYIISSGVCERPGCGKNLGEGSRVDLPAKGHRESGVQSCTTDVACLDCSKVTQPRFGHNFEMKSSAISSINKTVPTFFCTRCGGLCEDKLATFNAVTDKIKTDFYGRYDYANGGYPKLHRFIKSSSENVPSNISFGIWTALVKDMFMEEMANTPVVYDKILPVSVLGALPIYSEDYVSTLENKDVDSITVERVAGIEFSKVLGAFDNKFTVNKTEYDLTPYKATKVNGNVIKVSIDVKTEKYYGGIDRLPAAEQTALQKIFGVDVREQLFSTMDCKKDCPANCAEHHYVKGTGGKLYMETNQDGMGMKMTLNDMSTDGKVTYYFLEETYEPIIAIYEEIETMNQHMDMEINVGLVIKGKMDTLSKTNSTTVYVFPKYIPAA